MNPKAAVRRKIVAYLKKREHADTADIMMDCKVPLDLMLEVIEDLKKEGKVIGER
jgi:hypothetical protein